MKKIAIIGFGVVGSGVYEIIRKNKNLLTKNSFSEIDVKRILDIRDFSSHEESHLFTKNFDDILNDAEIEIVVETMGGVKFAYEYTKALLESGKSVVTSNKELVSKHGDEFFAISEKNNVRYLYEASVGGGIPVIKPLACDIAANEVIEISGILNGTTNYILTKMLHENESFESALKTAQELGYAEKDPTADVEGIDACRKISILMSLVTGCKVDAESINTVGISSLTPQDFTYASCVGCTIKLIASGFIENGRINASVEPTLVPKNHPLSIIEDVFNGVCVNANMADTLLFYGRGAGKLPTASAVMADVIDIVRNPDYAPQFSWSTAPAQTINYEDIEAKFLVRVSADKVDLVRAEFGDIEIIKGIDDYGFISPMMKICELNERIEKIGGAISRMRFMR